MKHLFFSSKFIESLLLKHLDKKTHSFIIENDYHYHITT